MTHIIAVDIDETCVNMWPMWLSWCNYKFEADFNGFGVGWNYNLQNVFNENAIDFWSDKDLYYNVRPMQNSVEVLEKLKSQGWQIGFVSYAKKGHFESKCDWVNKWFPFRDFIHCTKEKGFTRCTHFIDDRNKYLNQQPKDVKLIKMQTPYTQDEMLMREHFVVQDWYDFEVLVDNKAF